MYYSHMKHLILALLILIAAQPLQASSCGIDTGVDHSVHQAVDSDRSSSDCCDHDEHEPVDFCDPLVHCGAVPAGLAVLCASLDPGAVPAIGRLPSFKSQPLFAHFDAPPFRPPIS